MRLKAQLADMQSLQSSSTTSENQSTTAGTSMSEADIFQLKEKIEKLEQKSKDLDGEISRYRCAIDIEGGKIIQKLMAEQEKFKNQYEQKFQEFKRSMMRKFEREPHQYGLHYESDVDSVEGSYMESKGEPHGSSDSREGSDYDVPISKRKKTAESSSDTMADDDDNVMHYSSSDTQTDRPSLKGVMMELHALDHKVQERIEKCWNEIGIQLEIDYLILSQIKKTHHNKGWPSYDMAFRDMILTWLKRKGAQKTWLYFVEAVEHLKKFPEFTDHLRRKYCSPSNQSTQGNNTAAFQRPLLKDVLLEYTLSPDKREAEQRWEDIGIQLEVDNEVLSGYRGTERKEWAFKAIIRSWVDQTCPPPTWLRFMEALERLQVCSTLASHLRSKYCSSSGEPRNGNRSQTSSQEEPQPENCGGSDGSN